MKKLFYFAMALGLVACQAEKVDVNGGGEEGVRNYISVNIVSTPDNGTRAGGDTQSGDPSATYEEGYSTENTVEAVRFYFFDGNGNAAAVKADGKNYFDWKTDDIDESVGKEMPNVEKQLKAVIVISTKDGDNLPAQIAAVINPETQADLGTANLSLTALRGKVRNYAGDVNVTSPSFVMSNAVYANGATEVAATAVSEANYASSPELAEKNPVNIYVERNVAKVRVDFGSTVDITDNRIALKDKKGANIMVGGKQVYLQLSNWNLTAYTKDGYLSKHIDAAAWNTTAPFTNWNHAPYFRSFWAKNSPVHDGENNNQNWITYDEITKGGDGVPAGKGYGSTANSNVLYTNENAPQDNGSSSVEPFTKVILAGVLVVEDSDDDSGYAPVEITKYAGITSVGEDALRDALLSNLVENNNMIYWYKENAVDQTIANGTLSADQVEFKTAFQTGLPEGESNPGHYYVYLQLKDEVAADKNLIWASVDEEVESLEELKDNIIEDANAYLKNVIGKAQIYSEGMTYYYFPIEHLGATDEIGHYGVVRNHIYNSTITGIAGLGTPVYDPSEKIWPEHPVDDETYIAAKINILSWRLVNHDYNLVW